ncbi:type IV pilin [Haladaptatus cibarius]|uniref:type IV pilin n=1 Tax=Haladaptatus cibarius TaxID=453847 RepID=UPI0009FDD116|nr:type IV pilin N-terminal domain-containing protein [Haladaptatus cibarius]
MTLKEKFNEFRSETRLVSPVIGVILMVAITVILAAVIGTFVMGLGDSVQSNVQAGVSVDANAQDDTIDVTFTSEQQEGTNLNVSATIVGTSTDESDDLDSIGQSRTFTDVDGTSIDGESVKVVVTAEADGRSTVIYSETHDL